MQITSNDSPSTPILDKRYVTSFGVVTIFLGLVIERIVRGFLLINK